MPTVTTTDKVIGAKVYPQCRIGLATAICRKHGLKQGDWVRLWVGRYQ